MRLNKRKITHLWYKLLIPGVHKMSKRPFSQKFDPEGDPESM
jgi:hypothetical protein